MAGQEADQKVAERLDEALRKDQEVGPGPEPVKQPENPVGPEPQDPRLTALDNKHAEDLHKLDDYTKRMEEGLKSRYEGSPDLDGYLKRFSEMAEKQRESRLSEQAAERLQLQGQVFAEQQRTVNQQQQIKAPVPPPPMPPPPPPPPIPPPTR